MATDRDICKACDDLKYNAPHFVANGLTDKECQSLMNNTGLDPKANHDDCEDLHNMQDCLMEGLKEDIPAYDDCDWKTAFTDLLTNLNNMLQAIVCVICGLWDEITRIWNKIQQICNALNTLLALIRGSAPRNHAGTWTAEHKRKIECAPYPNDIPYGDVNKFFPSFQCDILDGATCDSNKKLGRFRLSSFHTDQQPPHYYVTHYKEPLVEGEVIGTIPMSAVVGEDMSEERWKNIIKSGSQWLWGSLGGDTMIYYTMKGNVVIDGVEFFPELRQYGRNTAVITSGPFIGPSRTGYLGGDLTKPVRSYDVTT